MLTHCNPEARESSVWLRSNQIECLTSPQGLAIKLGITPCFMPMLLAANLNRIALSAIRRAEVYAKAVS